MIDLEKYTQEYWGLMRQHAYRLTGSILDADDIVQDTMLRAIEMGPALENIEDHPEWLYTACTEAALSRLREKQPLELNEFDLPDLIQTTGSSANGVTKSVEAGAVWPSVALEFLFPLQYMTPEQRAVVVLRDGVEDGDRIAASSIGVKIQEVFKIADNADKKRAQIQKYWGKKLFFVSTDDQVKATRVFERFVEALGFRDKVLLQGLMSPGVELIVRDERRTGDDFVAVACTELLGQMGEKLTFSPVWLNGCRGVLIWTWRTRRNEWLRCGAITILSDDSNVKAMKWYLGGHLLRAIQTEVPQVS
ncbi:MAG: hypothetical protein J4F48_12640 [Nitrospinae bacterium]|nr:hypothetical protein [Nitrospinota bacterium]